MRSAEFPRTGLARISEVADFLSCSRTTVYKLINEGKLRVVSVSSDKRVRRDSAHQYIEEHEE